MAKNKTTTKKKPSKSTVGGSALKTKKSLNWKIIIPIIVLIALVGGFQVFRSRAETGKAFTRDHSMMAAEGADFGSLKYDGVYYKILKRVAQPPAAPLTTSSITTIVSRAELISATDICFNYRIFKRPTGTAQYRMALSQYQSGTTNGLSGSKGLVASRDYDTVCLNKTPLKGDSSVYVAFFKGDSQGVYDGAEIGISQIFGKL